MNKVFVVNGYGGSKIIPFGKSLDAILKKSFEDLGWSYSSVLCGENYTLPNVQDSVVLFVMPVRRYIKISDGFDKNNNKVVFWNVEPFGIREKNPNGKLHFRYTGLSKLIKSDSVLDKVWIFNSDGIKHFNQYDKVDYVPIGINESMCPTQIVKGSSKKVLLLGHATTYRENFIRCLHDECSGDLSVKKIDYVKYMLYPHPKIIDVVAGFRFGLDIKSVIDFPNDIRWHRIMFYAACKLVIFSDLDLSSAGFIDGEHYFRITDHLDLIGGVNDIAGQEESITDSMYKMAFEKYSMTQILEEALTKL